MFELIKQRRLKDQFKSQFGSSIEDFFDDKDIKEARQEYEQDKNPDQIQDDLSLLKEEEGDDQLLQRLMQANEEIDKIQQNKENEQMNIEQIKNEQKAELKIRVQEIL